MRLVLGLAAVLFSSLLITIPAHASEAPAATQMVTIPNREILAEYDRINRNNTTLHYVAMGTAIVAAAGGVMLFVNELDTVGGFFAAMGGLGAIVVVTPLMAVGTHRARQRLRELGFAEGPAILADVSLAALGVGTGLAVGSLVVASQRRTAVYPKPIIIGSALAASATFFAIGQGSANRRAFNGHYTPQIGLVPTVGPQGPGLLVFGTF